MSVFTFKHSKLIIKKSSHFKMLVCLYFILVYNFHKTFSFKFSFGYKYYNASPKNLNSRSRQVDSDSQDKLMHQRT